MKPVSIQFFLNHILDPVEVASQTRGMAKAGYQTVAGHARAGLLTPFMSDGWWDAVDAILEECKTNGMHYCIWDEDYFPSGHAGGRVIWSDPALIAGSLEFYQSKHTGNGPFEVDFDSGMFVGAWAVSASGKIIDISNSCGTRRQQWGTRAISHAAYSPQINFVGNPHWRTSFDDNKHAAVWTPDTPGEYTIIAAIVKPTPNSAPDILNPETIKRFIEFGYEPYYQRYPELFGSVIDTSFTDEPSPGGMTYPWTPAFASEFESEHGYNLIPYMPHLAMIIDDRSATIRHHYRLTQHRLMVATYLKQLADWCSDHKIEFTGHLTRTEWISLTSVYWPNELRCCKEMHVPCCDPLGAACAWPDASSYATGVKVVSSAAHLFGKKQAGSDALAVIGDEARLRDMKFMLDFQMVMGANAFMLHGASYSLDGPRKDEVPPSLSYHHSEWKHFPLLNNYLAETCEALTGGKHICEIAMLYPSTSLYCQADPSFNWYHLADEKPIHQLVDLLLSNQKDFDFIDEITLVEQTTDDGKLTTPEEYRHVVLPYIRYIDPNAADSLIKLAKSGLTIYVVGCIPQVLGRDPEDCGHTLDISGMHYVETPSASFAVALPGSGLQGDGSHDVFVLKRLRDDRPVSFLFNRSEKPFNGILDGIEVSIPGKGSLMLQPNTKPSSQPKPTASIDISDNWTCTFNKNTIPLNFWHAIESKDLAAMTYPVIPTGFNLMNRELDHTLGKDGHYIYTCRFFLTGKPADVQIVFDQSAITGDWKLYVNDIEITDILPAGIFDCLDLKAEIGHALLGGSSPTLNNIRIESSGIAHGIHEVMYLTVDFNCEYRYGHLSSPYLEVTNGEIDCCNLQDWSILGYPTYSGSATYHKSFEIPQSGDYLLQLGRVEDIAKVCIDGQEIASLAWQPYECLLTNMSTGTHILEIEITNSPANRTRAAHLPAGLFGPVSLSIV